MPWGCVIQPFAPIKSSSKTTVNAQLIDRCSTCFAYINKYAQFTRSHWHCPLCSTLNLLKSNRYLNGGREHLPELNEDIIEFDMDEDSSSEMQAESKQLGESASSKESEVDFPVFVFVVDVSGSDDYIELVKSAILAALETLPDKAWIGLLVFSSTVGLYNLKSEVPYVRFTQIPSAGLLSLPLDQVLPISNFLVRLGPNKDNVAAAVESIHSSSSSSPPSSSPLQNSSKRGLGSCLAALIDFLQLKDNSLHARLLVFLGGLVNWGAGRLDLGSSHRQSIDVNDSKREIKTMAPQTTFYSELAGAAASAGVCVDLFCVTEEFMDLASLKFLTLATGGNLLLYDGPQTASLPQDLYKQLSQELAFGGLFRVRTSQNFRLATCYGHLYEDREFAQVFRVAGCDPRKAICVDFDFTNESFLHEKAGLVQVAFSYMCMRDEPPRPARRLRVLTYKMQLARSLSQLYSSADATAVVALVTSQLIHVSLDAGVKEARQLLEDWLVSLVAAALNPNGSLRVFSVSDHEDTGNGVLSSHENLGFIPRFVFVMLKHALLATTGVPPDKRVYLQCLLSALEPLYLCKTFYPTLSGFGFTAGPDHVVLHLSQRAMDASGQCVFVLDAFTDVVVLLSEAACDLPCPPPANSDVRKLVKNIKQQSPLVSPQVVLKIF